LAKEYGVNPNAIYRLLGNQAQGASLVLELAKVKKENEKLLKIIDKLGGGQRVGEKN